MSGIIAFMAANWGFVSTVVIGLGAWHKEWIFRKLNIRKGNAEATTMERGIDTVYIENSEKLVSIYSKSMDDLNKRNEETIANIKKQYELDLKSMQDRYAEEREKDRREDEKRNEDLLKATNAEQELTKTVKTLKEEVKKLTAEVRKLSAQLAYYRKHTDIELPTDLQ